MMVIYVEVKGIKRVQDMLGKYQVTIPKAGRRGVYLFTNRLANEIRKEAKARGHVGEGYLTSPKGTFADKIDQDTWVVKMPKYTKYLEEGTSAGHWIRGSGKAKRWAQRHFKPHILSGGFVISPFAQMKNTIHRKGNVPHPFVQGVIRREVERELQRTIERQINAAIKNK